jgi:hypothetical protein
VQLGRLEAGVQLAHQGGVEAEALGQLAHVGGLGRGVDVDREQRGGIGFDRRVRRVDRADDRPHVDPWPVWMAAASSIR